MLPKRWPRYSAPKAWQASSITVSPCRSANCRIGSRSAGWPAKSTGKITFVRDVTGISASAGSRFKVSARNIGKNRRRALIKNAVCGGRKRHRVTLSLHRLPSSLQRRRLRGGRRPELKLTPYFAPTQAANASQNSSYLWDRSLASRCAELRRPPRCPSHRPTDAHREGRSSSPETRRGSLMFPGLPELQ